MLFIQHSNFAQKCTHSISGQITDDSTQSPLAGATIILKETSETTITNQKGYFELDHICPGNYHVIISHIGCEDKEEAILVNGNEQLNVNMPHLVNMLDGVQLVQKTHKATIQSVQVIKQQSIQKNANKNLANQLENLIGVTTLKNGNSIAKPVVHGMFGSRVMVLNNHIVQSGQQWGNDHAPEIDPLMAGSIEVVKGVAAMEYQGSGLGAVVNVLPKKIKDDSHVHGSFLYLGESNGLGNNANFSLQQKNKSLGWEITGSLKKYGDAETPNYYLNNTGFTETNIALQLEKFFSKSWKSTLYASSFNTVLGILRGSHVTLSTDSEDGELSDYALYILNAEQPLYTEENFSYGLDAPKQEVHHHILKWENSIQIDDDEKYQFTYAGQIDKREEYDIRRAGRSDVPALGLFQQTHFLEAKHQKLYQNNIETKKGIQYTFTDNTNDADTGILPLIPDYLSHQLGGFFLIDKEIDDWMFELGARYNFMYQSVAYIKRNTNNDIENYSNYFHNYSLAGGANYYTNKRYEWSVNVGVTSRNPDVNELYAYGLHQGVSGFERGDPNLEKETGVKTTLGLKGHIDDKWFFESLIYGHYVKNYIYLQSQNEYITTIRGTFPLFDYKQNNASIIGFDFGTNYLFSDELSMGAKYSFLRGENLSENVPLVYMPANNALITMNYKVDGDGFFKDTSLGLEYKYVWKQNHLLAWQDIKQTPNAYELLNLNFEKQLYIYHTNVKLYGGIDNVFNVTYRDYLNRMRYFADDLGRSFTLGFRVKF